MSHYGNNQNFSNTHSLLGALSGPLIFSGHPVASLALATRGYEGPSCTEGAA